LGVDVWRVAPVIKTYRTKAAKRVNATAIGEAYRIAIHAAVGASGGCDVNSGEPLDWTLLGTFDNDDSAEGGRTYKHDFALLPTVDHVDYGLGVFCACVHVQPLRGEVHIIDRRS
jgi:hypothetical protein